MQELILYFLILFDQEKNGDKNKYKNNTENKNDTEYNFIPLIKELESQEDERFAKSRFLKFIKDINSKKLIINKEKNIIEENQNNYLIYSNCFQKQFH